MDIVIPLGKGGQKFKDIELRYALRSIEKYLIGYENIWVIGERPEWAYCAQGIYFVNEQDVPGRKQYSLFKKLMVASDDTIVSDNFIYWHDDHFLLQPLKTQQIENWWNWTLEREVKMAAGTYKESVSNTIEVAKNGAYNYDIHVPCIFNKEKLKTLSRYNWAGKEYGFIIKSLYFNEFGDSCDPQMEDKKFRVNHSTSEIYKQIEDRLFFSLSHSALKENMLTVLQELYPEKSQYESDKPKDC